MDLIAERPTISGRSLTDLGCRVKQVADECLANVKWSEFRDSGSVPTLLSHCRLSLRERTLFRRAIRIGAAITVVADAASVGSDAGSIRHDATVIAAPFLSNTDAVHSTK